VNPNYDHKAFRCVICEKAEIDPKHVDTCSDRCFKKLLDRQRREAFPGLYR